MLICAVGNWLGFVPSIGDAFRGAPSGASLPVQRIMQGLSCLRPLGDCQNLPPPAINLPLPVTVCHELPPPARFDRGFHGFRTGSIRAGRSRKSRRKLGRVSGCDELSLQGRTVARPVAGGEKWSGGVRGPVTVCHVAPDQVISGESEQLVMRNAIAKCKVKNAKVKMEDKRRRRNANHH